MEIDDPIVAGQRARIVDALAKYRDHRVFTPQESDQYFNALADAAEFNRRHPEFAIDPPPDRRGPARFLRHEQFDVFDPNKPA